MNPLFLLLAAASTFDDPPPPPPKREPEPDDPPLKLLPPKMQSWLDCGPDPLVVPPPEPFVGLRAMVAAEGTAVFSGSFDEPPDAQYMQALHRHMRGGQSQLPPCIPSRRVADPEKKRARKAQKKARRAGR